MLAYDYPLLSFFWTVLMLSALAVCLFLVVWCFVDNLRRSDHHGVAKAIWFLVLLVIPFIGALVYIIARPDAADAPAVAAVAAG